MWILKHLQKDCDINDQYHRTVTSGGVIQLTFKGKQFYLLKDVKQYIVTRNEDCGHLVLNDDKSISRIHAYLFPVQDGVDVVDCGSKYGTFINDQIEANISLKVNEKVLLKLNDRIRFGRLDNVWQLDKIKIQTLTSTLTQQEREDVKKDLDILDANLLNDWTDECTHLTVSKLTATFKVLQAMAHVIPIVRPQYWKEYIRAIKTKTSIPNPTNFQPEPINEFTINVSFEPNIERKRLFIQRKFIFMTEKHMKKFETIIRLAGGECTSFGERRLHKNSLVKPNVVVVQYISSSTESQTSQSVCQIMEFVKSHNLRAIPDCEIGLAIMHCSTVKFCNPRHIMAADFTVEKLLDTQPTPEVLAKETLQESGSSKESMRTMIEVPETAGSVDYITQKENHFVDYEAKTMPFVQVEAVDVPMETDVELKRKHSLGSISDDQPKKRIALENSKASEPVPSTSAKLIPQSNCFQSTRKSIAFNSQAAGSASQSQFSSKRKNTETDSITSQRAEPPSSTSINRRSNQYRTNGGNNDDSDDDNLFEFGAANPIAKRSKPNSDEPFGYLTLSNTSRLTISQNTQRDTDQNRNTVSIVPRDNVYNRTKNNYIEPVSMGKWLSKNLIKNVKIEDGDQSNLVKVKKEDEEMNKDPTERWIDSIKNKIEVKTMDVTIRSVNVDNLPRNGNKTVAIMNENVKNFKKFVKINNYRPQTTVIKTIPSIF